MGEIAEAMLEGVFCQFCGEVNPDILDGGEEPGIPWSCGCEGSGGDGGGDDDAGVWMATSARSKRKAKGMVRCTACARRPFADVHARRQHIEAKAAAGDEAHAEVLKRIHARWAKNQAQAKETER